MQCARIILPWVVFLLSAASASAATPECLRQRLTDLTSRHSNLAAKPAFLDRMRFDNLDWVLETVRTEYDATAENVQREAFRGYLEKVRDATLELDEEFRSGKLSKDLKEFLRKQHRTMVLGKDGSKPYLGTTFNSSTGKIADTANRAGIYMGEASPLDTATITITSPSNGRETRPWTGPGTDLNTGAPHDLPGPFPPLGTDWPLWLPKVAEKSSRLGRDPHKVLPVNFRNASGTLRHRYPPFYTQPYYLESMSEVMSQIEQRLLHHPDHVQSEEVLRLIAEYYQIGINSHLFPRVNNSLLMNQVNYLLHFMGYRGIPHGKLDYFAMYKLPEDFAEIFMHAVAERNPGFK